MEKYNFFIHSQSHFHSSQHPSVTFVILFLGQLGFIGPGQGTVVEIIFLSSHVLLKQFSFHVAPHGQRLSF